MASLLHPAEHSVAGRISDAEFGAIRQLVYERFGINLTVQKRTLVVGRLQMVLRQRGFADFSAYLDWLRQDRTGAGLEELANRISTNHTFFYRERSHFEYFSDVVLPRMAASRAGAGDHTLRVWCAGCSTGEEPYTLMMLMLEFCGGQQGVWLPQLVATDISAAVLETAQRGEYTAERIEPLPDLLKRRYFRPAGAGQQRVSDEVRRHLVFRRHNLMDDRFPFELPFDAIFCRNVMIYFDRETRNRLVAKFFRHTRPGGNLFIGHSETLTHDETPWEYVMPAAYRRAR